MSVLLRLTAAFLLCALSASVPPPAAAAETVPLRIIAINDFHGHLEPGDNAVQVPHPDDPARSVSLRSGGAAYLATAVRRLRSEVPNSVFVSSGDLIGATPLVSALFRDEPTIEVMNLMGLELNVVGNHEFDQGVAELQRLIAGGCANTPRGELATCAHPSGRYDGARFPFIAANVVDAGAHSLLAPAWIRTVDGVKVGFIGAVTRSTPGIVMPTGIRGWRFLAEADAINRQARTLREQGVQALVALIHEGGQADGGFNDCVSPEGPIFDIARALDPAIGVVLSAHSHRAYNCVIGGRVVIQGAPYGRLVSVVDVEIDRVGGGIRRAHAHNQPVPNGTDEGADPALVRAYPPLGADPSIAAHVATYRERAAPLANRPVGRIAQTFDRHPSRGGDHAAGRLIADAQLAATGDNGAQIAFTNSGGVRSDLAFRAPDGAVTFADAFTMQPFGNSLVTLTLSGAQLKSLLEQQWNRSGERVRFLQPSRGFGYAWRADRPWGERVDADSMRLDGDRIRPERSYRVTVNSFLAAGGDGFRALREGSDAVGGPLDVDALVDYLRRFSADAPIAPDRNPRILRIGSAR
jgi:5'-nucleotidase